MVLYTVWMNLLNPKRGKKSPHPFYIKNATQRAEVIEFLRGLDTKTPHAITQ